MTDPRVLQTMRTYGWESDLPTFHRTEPRVIRLALEQFVGDAGREQKVAWDDSIPLLQRETGELLQQRPRAAEYHAILEYELPLEARRTDAVLLLNGPVVLIEFKMKDIPSQADIDQVAAYVRDLKYYHSSCADRSVKAVVVPTKADGTVQRRGNVYIVGPAGLDALLVELLLKLNEGAPDAQAFLADNAYRPLPTLVQAARELFESRDIKEIWRARASTDPAVNYISRIAHQGARDRSRHLVLVRGVPGSGKTLVGLRTVHAKYLDDLAVARANGKPTAAGIFLSGNGPLVQVLQYELKKAGGAGKAFVRGMKDYLNYYVPKKQRIPDQHIVVFDEAQRAFNIAMVAETHQKWDPSWIKSEPELIIELADRIPEWCAMVGLIGSGQEIHKGEEDGIELWRQAVDASPDAEQWTIHVPVNLAPAFKGTRAKLVIASDLNLDVGIRQHFAGDYAEFIEALLVTGDTERARAIAAKFNDPESGAHISLLVTRDLKQAKQYLHDRYRNHSTARYGLLASSKDKVLERDFGVPNSWQSTKRVKLGPWYADGLDSPHSCTQLSSVVTEFGAQGLELDMALLAWGTDFIHKNGAWSTEYSGGYRKNGIVVKDPFNLRRNAYRVLLTRGRDGTVVYVPDIPALNETYQHLLANGFVKNQ